TIKEGDKIGISGPNGSGKSTLLKIISGQTSLTKGRRTYQNENSISLEEENIYDKISFAAPYIELIEEFNLLEMINFYHKFRPLVKGLKEYDLVELSTISHTNKLIKTYSSGMKQRVKLLLALCFEAEVILLDEPSTNLDKEGVEWTNNLIYSYLLGRTLIIASNDVKDFDNINSELDIRDYK
ncbi:MAG TPA: ATP-binding cassette domain-containing protein, partial [Saprospiraceae bacterium]|nr:ATP-binding cassette domain-containing protein [Saprospiraceae bacterium]